MRKARISGARVWLGHCHDYSDFAKATEIYQRFMQTVYWNWWCLVADRDGGGW